MKEEMAGMEGWERERERVKWREKVRRGVRMVGQTEEARDEVEWKAGERKYGKNVEK